MALELQVLALALEADLAVGRRDPELWARFEKTRLEIEFWKLVLWH
jgi:hypothetical protein